MATASDVWDDAVLRGRVECAMEYVYWTDPAQNGERRGSAGDLIDAAMFAMHDIVEGKASYSLMEEHLLKIRDAASRVANSKVARHNKSFVIEGLIAVKVALYRAKDTAAFAFLPPWAEMVRDIS